MIRSWQTCEGGTSGLTRLIPCDELLTVVLEANWQDNETCQRLIAFASRLPRGDGGSRSRAKGFESGVHPGSIRTNSPINHQAKVKKYAWRNAELDDWILAQLSQHVCIPIRLP